MDKYRGLLAPVANSLTKEEIEVFDYINDVTDKLYSAMEEKGISKAELARRLGKSRSWVTQLLAGDSNFTMKTMVQVTHALGMCPKTMILDRRKNHRNTSAHSDLCA